MSFKRVPPCGAGSFLSGQKGTKDPLGAASLLGAAVVARAAGSRPYGEGRTWSLTGPVRTPAPTRRTERFLRADVPIRP